MLSRADIPLLALVAVGLLLIPTSLASTSVPFALQAVILLSLIYAAYWALDIRNALAVGIYRNQALGVALVALSFGVLDSSFIIFPNSAAAIPAFWFALVVSYYYMDASVLAARRSDPLLRDTLQWRSLRVALYALIAILMTVSAVSFIATNGPPSEATPLTFLLLFLPGYPVLAAGSLALPISVLRSRDATLRRQVKWFGAFVLLLLGPLLFSPALSVEIGLLFGIIGLLGGSYCLYRSARALVPLNRVDLGQLDSAARLKVRAIRHPVLSLSTHIEQSQGML